MHIKTRRLILRPWAESDAPSLYKYASAPRTHHVTCITRDEWLNRRE